MAQPTNLFPQPFADSGDKNIIPVSSATTGAATLPAGFPPITSLPLEAGGVAPTRQDFNGVLYMLSAIACWTQAGGLWTYSATTNYEPPCFTSQNGALYWCKSANGPSGTVKAPASDTAGTYWVMLMDASGMLNTALLNIATPSTYGTVKASTTAAAGVAPLGDSNGALSGWAATESKVGATRLATSAETQTGTAATIAVTPAGLASRTATADRSGIIEIATTAETATGTDATRAVSPAGLKGSLSTLVPPATATTYGTVKASTTIAANTVPLATSSGTLDSSWSSYQLSDTAPIVAGTAAAGTGTTVSRSDHVHPAQVDITGNAASATKLVTARTFRTDLASTSTASFDGTANVTPGVTGILPVANGGTGNASGSATSLVPQSENNGIISAGTSGHYNNAAFQAREVGYVRETQTNIAYAPRIGWHWSDVAAGSLLLDHGGSFVFTGTSDTTYLVVNAYDFFSKGRNCWYAPQPTTSAGVGQIYNISSTSTVTLPSGGTWFEHHQLYSTGGISLNGDCVTNIVAGGTTVGGDSSVLIRGFAIRIS